MASSSFLYNGLIYLHIWMKRADDDGSGGADDDADNEDENTLQKFKLSTHHIARKFDI